MDTAADENSNKRTDNGTTADLGRNCCIKVGDNEIVLSKKLETVINLDSLALDKLLACWHCIKQVLAQKDHPPFHIQLSYDFDPEQCKERKVTVSCESSLLCIDTSVRDVIQNQLDKQNVVYLNRVQCFLMDKIMPDIKNEFWSIKPVMPIDDAISDSSMKEESTCDEEEDSFDNIAVKNKHRFSAAHRKRRQQLQKTFAQNE